MKNNYCIKCDVTKCRHNTEKGYCGLGDIKVTCGNGKDCTRCDDYSENA